MNTEWLGKFWARPAFNTMFLIVIVLTMWVIVPVPNGAPRLTQVALGLAALVGATTSHRLPATGFSLAFVATAVAWALGLTDDPFLLAAAALYSLAVVRGRRPFPLWTVCALFLGLLMAALVSPAGNDKWIQYTLFSAIVLICAWAFGVTVRQSKELAIENATIQERDRLARDVHDVLSHSLGTIGVRAGIAGFVETLSIDQLRETLQEIEQISRSSMADLKGLLSATHAVSDSPGYETQLEFLLTDTAEMARGAGLDITLDVGDTEPLDMQLKVVVHRIVREAVTNVIRHAHASHCLVQISVANNKVNIAVKDNGSGKSPAACDGFGLTGMRQRVALLGGTLTACNLKSGGFEVAAQFPNATRAV